MKHSRKEETDFQSIEKKWQERWQKERVFEVHENKRSVEKKLYVLEMFPYPSGSGLHMGHAFNYTIGDIYARYKRMQGFQVLYPMGYDSFGLPAENAAIKEGKHPKKFTESAIKNFILQQHLLGLSYDWSRMIKTSDPEYYLWNQYFFLQFYKKGLIYRKKANVNWCRKCTSVLANEQVHNGKCWRHPDTEIEIKQLEQWFLKTSDYANELLRDIEKLDWPERIKIMQRNWIGRSEGSEIIFKINKEWSVFTTRPDTLFGVTFLVIALNHPELMKIVTKEQKNKVLALQKKITSTKDIDLVEKEGIFTGSYATHPLTGEKIPVYAGNFVLAEYGSGMVMAVPAHDQRDFEFAKKYKLPIKVVIQPEGKGIDIATMKEAYEGSGKLINSQGFDGLFSEEAKEHITIALQLKKLGKKSMQYKLRDWLISRQRYWGTPIPIIYCDECGMLPVPEKDLPVLLPEKVVFGKGNPLETSKTFVKVKCYQCGKSARRETDTMDTFVDSSWYFLRYCDSKNSKKPFDTSRVEHWMPVDMYIGGAEHACMHLIYARFFTKVLRDLSFLKINEPFPRLFNQGMLHGEDGFVMSKSRGNIIDPLDVINQYGSDSLRLFLVSVASPDKDFVWSSNGIEGSWKFLKKIVGYFSRVKQGKSNEKTEHYVNKTIQEVSTNLENMTYNFAIIKIRALFERLENEISKKDLSKIIKLLAPFCPHLAEELWERLGNEGFISLAQWPSVDEKKINDRFDKAEEAIESVVRDILNILTLLKEKQGREGEKIYIYTLPAELEMYNPKKISDRVGKKVEVFSVNDKNKHDPTGKSGKARPGKPAIYIK